LPVISAQAGKSLAKARAKLEKPGGIAAAGFKVPPRRDPNLS
jgi:hypothetical protein